MAKNIERTEVALNLISLRKENNLNQTAVADILGIKRDTYARYETDTYPPINIIRRLCEYYNVTSDFIINKNDEPYDYHKRSYSHPLRFASYNSYNQPENADSELILSPDECELVERFRKLSPEKQEAILMLINN